MPKFVTSAELKKNTKSVIDWARAEHEAIIVETSGQPLVAILPFDEYQDYLKYKEMQQSRTARFERLRQLAEQNATYDLNEQEAATVVDQIREEVYQLKRSKPAKT